jgi:hypothetical protein
MKKIIYTALFLSLFTSISYGQLSVGAGATYLNDGGVQLRAQLPLVDGFDVEPKFSYYFVDDATSWSVDVDATYDLITFGESNPLYVLTGPALYRTSFNGGSDSNLGYNFGAGLGINHLRFELKYTTIFCDECNGQIGGNLAYMF